MNLPETPTDRSLVEQSDQQAELAEAIKNMAEPVERDWPDVVPFDVVDTPNIPASLLPVWLGEYAKHVSLQTQTPPGMAVLLSLSVVAACLQKQFEVVPKRGWREPINLWTVTALPPGSCKSAVVSSLTEPLKRWENDKEKLLAKKIAQNNSERAVSLKRIEALEKRAAKEDDPKQRQVHITDAAKLREEMPDLMLPPRIFVDDVTPERLQNLMVENEDKIALFSDESGIFDVMSGLYNDGRVNINVFLQAHAGSSVRVERAGRSAYMDKPALTFGLALQPHAVEDLSKGSKRKFRGTGALARFLYCIPKSNIGRRDLTDDYEIPGESVQAYEVGIRSLLDLPVIVDIDDKPVPQELTLSADARKLWQTFRQQVENEQGEGGKWENIQDWTSKLAGAVLRIAGLCHVVEYGHRNLEIGAETMFKAIELGSLLVEHALAAFSLVAADQTILNARYILSYLKERGVSRIGRTELKQLARFKNDNVLVLDSAIFALQERHYLSEEMKDETTKKPKRFYLINGRQPAL